MDIPSLFMIPSAVSSGKVHSVFPNSTDADFDFNRDSSATRVNSQGFIETVGYFSTEKLTGFTNGTTYAFTTFTTSGNNITSAIVSSAFAGAVSNAISVTSGQTYRVTFDYTKNSGNDLRVVFSSSANGAGTQISNNHLVSSSGSYSFDFTITSTTTGYLQMGTGNSGHSLNVSISNVSVKEIQGDRARLNYEIDGGLVNTKPSLLLEPQSTNLVTYSEDFSQWVVDGQASISSDSIISPDGTINSDKLIAGTTSGRQAIKFSSSNSGNLSFSIFAKKGEYSVLQLSDAKDGSAFANFNLETGAVGSTGVYTASMVDMGNDWYRCKISWNASLGIVAIRVGIVTTATSARVEQFAGNGIKGLYIYGAQLEQQTYCTSYIPTNGSAQTRAAETCIGAGTSSIFESSEGILYCEIAALANDGTARQISLSDGSSSTNKVSILYTSTTNQIKAFVRGGGSIALNTTHTLSNALQFNKIALKYKVNDFSLYVNGTEVLSDTSGAIPTALSDLSLDDADGTQDFYGKIRDIRVYNTKEMTDSEVDILLTKITS